MNENNFHAQSKNEHGSSLPPLPLPQSLMLLALTFALPPDEASIFIANVRFSLTRILLLVLLPAALFRIIRDMSGNRYVFVWSDLLFIVAGFWIILSIWVTEPSAIVRGASTALEFSGAYIIVRGLLSAPGQTIKLAGLLSGVFAVAGLMGILDTIFGYYFTHDVVGMISGNSEGLAQEPRFGFVRAAGPLEHPILLGTVCAFAILLATALHGSKRWLITGGAGIGLIASISAGSLLAAVLGITLLIYRWMTPSFTWRWAVLWVCGTIGLASFLSLHSAPFGWLLGHIAFDANSAYYRLIIWRVAGELVLNSPAFGVGISGWARPDWMPETVDSVWLRCAMCFGIPGACLIGACLAGACSRSLGPANSLSPDERYLGVVLSIILFLYFYMGFTVHFWGTTWILMGVFAGMRAHLGALASRAAYDTEPLEPATATDAARTVSSF